VQFYREEAREANRPQNGFFYADLAPTEMDVLKSLPKGTVLQISEKDGLDKDVFIKSSMLKKLSYQIAVNHVPTGLGASPLHQMADFVRVDALSLEPDQIESTVALLRKRSAKVIAVNVQDRDLF